MLRSLPLFLLWACTGVPSPPDPAALVADLGVLDAAERTCLEQACTGATTPEALQACRATSCAPRDDVWTLVPTTIRHADDSVFVQARLGHQPGGYGDVDAVRDQEAFVGVTVITSDGREIDLAVSTVFPDNLEAPFTLSSDVGPDVRDVIFGVWDRKVQPCESERSGCKEFGFLLDGSLATWPPGLYTEGLRQRIPPATVDLLILDAGAGASLPKARTLLVESLTEELAVFGSQIGTVTTRVASAATPTPRVEHADEHDRLLARAAGEVLRTGADGQVDVVHSPDGGAPFVVTVPGPAEVFSQVQDACGTLADDAFDACVTDTLSR